MSSAAPPRCARRRRGCSPAFALRRRAGSTRSPRTGSATERGHALTALHDLAGTDGERAAIVERARADKAKSVQALAERWEATPAAEEVAVAWDLPPVPPVRWANAVSPALRDALAQVADGITKATNAAREAQERYAASRPATAPAWRVDPVPAPPKDLRARLELMVTSDRVDNEYARHWLPQTLQTHNAMPPLAGRPDLAWPSLVRLLNAGRHVNATPGPAGQPIELLRNGFTLDPTTITALTRHHVATGTGSLRELAAIYDDMGWPGASVVATAALYRYQPLGRGWDREAVWPFVAEHLDGILGLYDEVRGAYWSGLERWLELLGTLPTQPPAVRRTLLEHALGTKAAGRAETQAALAGSEDLWADVVPALADGKADVRGVAAAWLARIADERALPALEKAVAKERNDVVKGRMLDALEALGRPVEDYLDLDALAADAAATVAKPLPKDLDWFPWDGLPEVRWAASGDVVPRDVIVHLVVQAQRAKTPEPGAILRKYCAMFDPRDRERLGQFVLDAWISADLTPAPHEEALAQATRQAQQWQQTFAQHGRWYADDPRRNFTLDQLIASEYAQTSRQPVGSCTSSKGVLAVAAACAGADAAASAGRYLRDWYGMRASQGKALIAMLGWIEHRSATQLMLSIGSRFRTKGLQDEANRQAIALAERRGWSLDELADRTIPTAGFDETGVLQLSYGPRVFTATLRPDLSLVIRNDEGKEVKTLPPPRASDDADAVKAAKKALTAARKELKGIESEQTTRLYEAMCLQRGWPLADWQAYLRDHPVLRFLVQRLVWRATVPVDASGEADGEGEGNAFTFRPLDDGTLTDVDDDEVVLPDDAVITLAHETNVPAGLGSRWLEHLADYEVAPAFQQFGKETFELTDERRLDTEVKEFEGHLVEAFKLRGRATKLGYTRGSVQDAGWFYSYEKRFPTLRLAALIEFTGNGLPEENRTVALRSLGFVVRDPEAGSQGGDISVALGEVPPLLLAEAFDDLRSIAAAGTGFDPDWERTTQP